MENGQPATSATEPGFTSVSTPWIITAIPRWGASRFDGVYRRLPSLATSFP